MAIDQETRNYIDEQIRLHIHDGNLSQRINAFDIFGVVDSDNITAATIATTGNTDTYYLVTADGTINQIDFSGVDALAASDTNYVTFSVTNLGQAGAGSTAILAATNANTTKTTGGTALSANTKRTLTLSGTPNNLQVAEGDRLQIRAAVTGTLANTVTFPTYLIQLELN